MPKQDNNFGNNVQHYAKITNHLKSDFENNMDPVSATIGISTFVLKPLYDGLVTKVSDKLAIKEMEQAMVSYATESRERCRYLRVFVKPDQKQLFDSLYVPLSLLDASQKKVRCSWQSLLTRGHRNLIVATAGFGKTTALKTLYLELYKQQAIAPIFIFLRDLNEEHQSLLQYIKRCLGVRKLTDAQVKEVLNSSKCALFLDGIDELDADLYSNIVNEIQNLSATCQNLPITVWN